MLGAGFLGRVHPAFDAFSHFRVHAAAALALIGGGLLAFRAYRLVGLGALALGMAIAAVTLSPIGDGNLLDMRAQASAIEGGARYRLLQINVLYDNASPEKVLSTIGRTSPDVVTLDEVPVRWQEKLDLIKAAYPYRILCPPPSRIGGVAILSRRPFEAGTQARCYDRGSMAIASVDFGGRPVKIVALHLGWPWPFDQPHQLKDIAPILETRLPGDTLLAGDFNAAPWSQTVRRVAEAGRLKILRGIGPTWLDERLPDMLRKTVGLPIDNVLVRGDLTLTPPRRLDFVGSDHLPVLVEFRLKPKVQSAERMEAQLAD